MVGTSNIPSVFPVFIKAWNLAILLILVIMMMPGFKVTPTADWRDTFNLKRTSTYELHIIVAFHTSVQLQYHDQYCVITYWTACT